MSSSSSSSSVVEIAYDDLVAGKDLSEEIFQAYGPGGLGALTISGVPGFVEARSELLPLGHKLGHLPEEAQKKLEHPPSLYNAGWSFGKEKLGDKPDTAKGSFYANPLYDKPGSEEEMKKWPYFYPENIWPKEDVPELEEAFKKLGKIMFDAVVLLTKQIDRVIKKHIPDYEEGMLHKHMSTTRKVKGRLLYYYPVEEQKEDGWIGWHNDSGFLTALTSAIFMDDKTGEVIDNPDPNGGLWIVDRDSEPVRVRIPPTHLAVQCGECLQVISGGLLVATPHCVRPSACKDRAVGRATFPVFIDTNDLPLSPPKNVAREKVFEKTTQSKVPPLEKRWTKNDMSFAEFLGETFNQYYAWTKQQQEAKDDK